MVASAQFSGAGYYRVKNAFTLRYMSIKGTAFDLTTRPDAFWSCAMMLNDSAQNVEPGSIIYIPSLTQTSLCAQGVSTYSLTNLLMDVEVWPNMEDGRETYIAKTRYFNEITNQEINCVFRDYGCGFTAGTSPRYQEAHWWIEPVNEESMETSFLGVQPASEKVMDADGWYWTSMTCDFPFMLPVDGGVEGAYTVKEVTQGEDGLYYATAVKVYGQGETVPGATPVLLKCKASYASGNKIIPVGELANCTQMPIVNDLLMGNYFSNFTNHCSLNDPEPMTGYFPKQATAASSNYMALGIDDEGRLGFFPQEEGTYMAANTAWLSTEALDAENAVMAIYLVEEKSADVDPGPEPDPEPNDDETGTGDANGDGEVNISDVALLISYLSGADISSVTTRGAEDDTITINLQAVDMNKDNMVNISDVTILIRQLVGVE